MQYYLFRFLLCIMLVGCSSIEKDKSIDCFNQNNESYKNILILNLKIDIPKNFFENGKIQFKYKNSYNIIDNSLYINEILNFSNSFINDILSNHNNSRNKLDIATQVKIYQSAFNAFSYNGIGKLFVWNNGNLLNGYFLITGQFYNQHNELCKNFEQKFSYDVGVKKSIIYYGLACLKYNLNSGKSKGGWFLKYQGPEYIINEK